MKEVSEQPNKDEEVSCNNVKIIESSSRRKAVKTLVGGVTALAAYNLLPAKWGTPVIDSIFLPAHAATSGNVTDFITLTSFSQNGVVSGTTSNVTVVTTFNDSSQPQSFTYTFENLTNPFSQDVIRTTSATGTDTFTDNWYGPAAGDTVRVTISDYPANLTLVGSASKTFVVV